jgi:hypothetical protein
MVIGVAALSPSLIPPLQPIIENGKLTLALVEQFQPPKDMGGDADNDGMADAKPVTVIDALDVVEDRFSAFDNVYYGAPTMTATQGKTAVPTAVRLSNGLPTHTHRDWKTSMRAINPQL